MSEGHLERNDILKLLKTSPEALDAFEKAYQTHGLGTVDTKNIFELNSRQASEILRQNTEKSGSCPEIESSIVKELLSQTETLIFNGENVSHFIFPPLPEGTPLVSLSKISSLPGNLRPQLTGYLMKRDIDESTCATLLWLYKEMQETKDPESKRMYYNHFRQGLDILDLDPVTYEILGMNKNSMSYWLPSLVEACKGSGFFKIPKTTIAKVPISLLQLTRQEYGALTATTLHIVDKWAKEAFRLNKESEYFIKTGTYSSKFDFRNCYVHEGEVSELGEYLLFIHFQALQMASPLTSPIIYGVSTTNEWVVREYIRDKESNPTIYKGLPLHTEYRVFVDCDTDCILGITPYWEPGMMKKRFSGGGNVHEKHDYLTFCAHEQTLMQRYECNKGRVLSEIDKLIPKLGLSGQWSIDIMQNGEDFWLIDMAVAENSAFYDIVPKELRRPQVENWLPKIPSTTLLG